MIKPTMQKTSSLYLLKLVEVLTTLGVKRQDFLQIAGLAEEEISDRDAHISLDRYLAAVQCALDLSRCEELGFLVGGVMAARCVLG